MSGQDAEWAEPGLRQVMIQQIEDTYRTFGNPTQKPSTEVERHILEKAQSRDDYLQLGARLILHIKEIKSNQRQLQTPVSANNANSNNNMVLPQQGQIANVSIANNSNINQQLKLQQQQQQLVINQQNTNKHQQLLQQQQQQLLAKQIANANNTSNLTQTLNANQPLQAQIMLQRNLQTQQQASANSQQQLVTSQLSLQNQLGNMGLINVTSINMPLQNQVFAAASQQQQRQQVQQQLQLKQQLQQQQNLLHQQQQQQQQQQVKQTAEQEQLQLLKQLQNKQQLINQGASLQNANTGNTRLEFSPMLNKSNVPKQQTSNMMQASPAKNVPAPSPQPQPSPQMQPTPSPAFINPPSVGPAQSPSTNNDAYVDKLKEMSKYIDPLAKLISRMPKDEGRADHVKERNKMNGLLDMLTNRNRRVTLPVLSKCENVLKKLFPDATLTSVSTATPDTSTVDSIPTPVAKPHSALQPVGEVVTNVITSANIMSDTQQNILPGMLALNAPMITPPLPPCRKFRKRKLPEGGEKKPTLPRPLQMEIVSLCNRFDISVDRSKPFDSAGFTMNCRLKDDSVSSKLSTISVAMRPDYPISEPVYFLSDTHDNISSIRRLLGKQLSKTSDRITFTQILNRWEMCVYDVLDE